MIRMARRWIRNLSLGVCLIIFPQLLACGTLLYPERDGQRSGEIDLVVALMDGVGLLFFVIPGIVAFAVDFHTGAIYLPPDHPRNRFNENLLPGSNSMRVVTVDPDRLDKNTISNILFDKTGLTVRLDDPRMIINDVKTKVDIAAELKKLSDIGTTTH